MKRVIWLPIATLAILATLAAAKTDPASRLWTAKLSGAQESPAVKAKATGSATVKLVAFGDSSVQYTIRTGMLKDVTMAHLHYGAKGENGPIVVQIQTPEAKGKSMVSEGKFHASDLSGPLAGKDLHDFAEACDAGNIYVNVHTQAHPDGEVRGQLRHGGGAMKTTKAKTTTTKTTTDTTSAH